MIIRITRSLPAVLDTFIMWSQFRSVKLSAWILFPIFFCSISLQAQLSYNPHLPSILPQAPNTAMLGKFGDYEVSHFTGIPQISIPLYSIRTTGFEIPITLVYHASGNKLHQFASWVGTGWALDAGGQVSRKLVGKADDYVFGFLYGEPRKASDISYSNPSNDVEYLKNVNGGSRDNGADIFSYSFPGGSGKFFFDKDNNFKPVIMPYSPVRIRYQLNSPQSFGYIDVDDAVGNQYQFGGNYREAAFSVMSEGNSNDYTSAWMLEKMISPGKLDTIYFSYQMQTDHPPLERSDTWTVDDKVENNLSHDATQYYFPNQSQTNISYLETRTTSANHQEIKFSNGRVLFELDANRRQDFNQNDNSKALKYIKVFSKTADGEKLIRTIALFHSYFIDGVDNASKRLRLDSVQVLDDGSSVVNTYRFEYNTTINLPSITSQTVSKDFWGYYNGRSNTSLVPQTDIEYNPFAFISPTTTISIGSTNPVGREPDVTYMQASILKRIRYPTGGYTDFEYEGNNYLDEQSNQKFAGGLRIKTIKSYDGFSSIPTEKTFKYGADGSGRANFFRGNEFFIEEQQYENWVMGAPMPYLTDRKRRRSFYSAPTIEIEPFDGAVVVYPEVTEYIVGGMDTLGKTVYQFRDQPDDLSYTGLSTKPVVRTLFFDRGQLLNKKTFKRSAPGIYLPIEEERYTYNTPFERISRFGGLSVRQFIVRETVTNYEPAFTSFDWAFNNFYYVTDDNYMTSNERITYNPDDSTKFVKSTTLMEYGNFIHQQATALRIANSKNDSLITRKKFPADYVLIGQTNSGNAVLDTMIAKNMNAIEIENWMTRIKQGESAKVAGGQVNMFKRLSSGIVVPDLQKSLLTDELLTSYQIGTINAGALLFDPKYESINSYNVYDSKGNILEIQKVNDYRSSYLWDYNAALPVAEVKNASSDHVAYTSFEADGTGYWTISSALRETTAAITGKRSFSISNAGITGITKSGLNTTQEYIVSYWSQNVTAYTVTGTLNAPVKERSFNGWSYYEHRIKGLGSVKITGSGLIDELRLYPADAQMSTYTYEPLIGTTNQCSVNNQIVYYEYDSFGRLKVIRDQDGKILKQYDYQYKASITQ
jgi:YD repeat-containing protein